jgi:hypothetical protein
MEREAMTTAERGLSRMRTPRSAVERVDLAVGDKVKFAEERTRYTVRAVSADGRWAICTRPFNLQRTVLYSIIDFDSGVRGSDNMVFSFGYESDEQIAENMSRLESGVMEVSVRRDCRLNIESVTR